MDKELEDKINDLGQHYGGRLVRFAYYKSLDDTNQEASAKIGRHKDWYDQYVPEELKKLVHEVASGLVINRVINAHEQTAILMANSAVEAGEVVLNIMRHPNPKFALPAAREVLKTVGVNPDVMNVNVSGVSFDIEGAVQKRLDKVYGDESGATDSGSGEAESTKGDA